MRGVVVVGAGRRARDAALPALRRIAGRFELRGVMARSARRIDVDGASHEVEPLRNLDAARMRDVDLVYVAVGKPSVPDVLAALTRFDVSKIDLLVDTPVVLLKHFRHVESMRRFRNVWVSEDCVELPCFDPVKAVLARGEVGAPRGMVFLQSAYAYHGLATLKAVLGAERVVSGRRRTLGGERAIRTIRLSNGTRGEIHEPRDYAVGRIVVEGAKGSISDDAERATRGLRLEPVLEGAACRGFRVGDVISRLDDDEAALMADGKGASDVTARMEAMKRVGFLRLLRRIDSGSGAYPLDQALEDMVVDAVLQRAGRWLSTPLTDVRSAPARALYGLVSRIAGR